MSIEFWTGAETFYELWLIVIGVVLVILLATLIFVATRVKGDHKNKLLIGLLSLTVLLVSTGVLGHVKYQPYIDLVRYVNPLVRDRRPSFVGYIYYSRTEQTAYSQLNSLETLRAFELYEEVKATEPVEYLGEGEYYHYFEHENETITKYIRDIEFTEDVDQAQFVGSQFQLKDEAFLDIGFKNIDRIIFEKIEIPASEVGKTHQPEDDYVIPKSNERMNQWNF